MVPERAAVIILVLEAAAKASCGKRENVRKLRLLVC